MFKPTSKNIPVAALEIATRDHKGNEAIEAAIKWLTESTPHMLWAVGTLCAVMSFASLFA